MQRAKQRKSWRKGWVTPLRELMARRFDTRWPAFADEHPNLAAAIDRTRLIESAVENLQRDDAYRQAMRDADLDERQLLLAAEALDRLEQTLALVMPK